MERYLAIDNVCAWPNLTMMPNGDVVATIFNQPCHGQWEGDVECWASTDGGRLWHRRGVAAAHAPGTNRMNVAAGLAGNGDFLVIASGWDDRPAVGQSRGHSVANVLTPWICRSSDGGRTWAQAEIAVPADLPGVIPFGNIVRLPDGVLAVAMYSWSVRGTHVNRPLALFSDDDGHTWGRHRVILDADHNETDLLVLKNGDLLAACRTRTDQHLELARSQDGGQSWEACGALTLPMQHPGHLLQLDDDRILLHYGVRNQGGLGVACRFSADGGVTWDAPRLIFHNPELLVDGGYPAAVQLADRTIVTAWYCARTHQHHRYHMGVCRWTLDE